MGVGIAAVLSAGVEAVAVPFAGVRQRPLQELKQRPLQELKQEQCLLGGLGACE